MAIDPQVIQSALDSFENDDLITSKNLIRDEIVKARNDFIKTKLNLTKDIKTNDEK